MPGGLRDVPLHSCPCLTKALSPEPCPRYGNLRIQAKPMTLQGVFANCVLL